MDRRTILRVEHATIDNARRALTNLEMELGNPAADPLALATNMATLSHAVLEMAAIVDEASK